MQNYKFSLNSVNDKLTTEKQQTLINELGKLVKYLEKKKNENKITEVQFKDFLNPLIPINIPKIKQKTIDILIDDESYFKINEKKLHNTKFYNNKDSSENNPNSQYFSWSELG